MPRTAPRPSSSTPAEPDHVFIDQAQCLAHCCRNTLYTLARRGN